MENIPQPFDEDSVKAKITELISEQKFNDFVKCEDLSVVHFYTPWVVQCKHITDILQELSKLKEYRKVKFAKIHAETVPEVSLKFDVSAVPVVIFIKNSAEIDRVNGANAMVLTDKLKHHTDKLKKENPAAEAPKTQRIATEERLKSLVNQAPCMLFMKGTPTKPRCGFSKKIIAILDESNVDYQAYDILEDNEAREGLKTLYKWPTFPQLYFNGMLLGGLDIITEMKEIGDIEKMLPKKNDVLIDKKL